MKTTKKTMYQAPQTTMIRLESSILCGSVGMGLPAIKKNVLDTGW